MNLLVALKENVAASLASAKAYDLPNLCTELGLQDGEESEAYSSKYHYVLRRVQPLGKEEAVAVAQQALERYPSFTLEEILDLLNPPKDGAISSITRRHLIDEISSMDNLAGDMHVTEFLGRLLPLSEMPYGGSRLLPHSTLADGVDQHMVRNNDWSYKDFFDQALILNLSERRFRSILEGIVHPEVRTGESQKRFVEAMNPLLLRGGCELQPVEQTSGYPVYRVVKERLCLGPLQEPHFCRQWPKA